ncbi:unnamed protein product [Adineta ricciae]|uniref:Uncharacterized protein n=1 Tax=Adineta ricciae TaxID=249248 RepID=A0A813QDG3_ADIRI|nr:unnamed protein product [Adineta ricciae]
MSLKTFPIIFFNMGGEMIYILEQRLTAQDIMDQKSVKVINEIVGAMFNTRFLEEIFRPQELYPKKAVKHIFEKIAHTSIMRLNEASMDKLYDLMSMSVKYQIMLCPCASDIVKVTYNHVNTIRKLVRSFTVLDLLDKAFLAFNKFYERLNDAEWLFIRDTTLFFFQDVHIRVSVFLREDLQTQEGQFIMKTNGVVPTGFQPPGEIRTYTRGRLNNTQAFNTDQHHQPADDTRTFQLGLNIFSKSRSLKQTILSEDHTPQATSMVNAASDIEMLNPDPKMLTQLSLLSQLIGSNTNNDASRSGLVKLSLFDDDDDEDDFRPPPPQSHPQQSFSTAASQKPKHEDISIDVSKRNPNSRLSHVLQDLDFDERPARRGKNSDDDDNDLCAMMDRLPNSENKRR